MRARLLTLGAVLGATFLLGSDGVGFASMPEELYRSALKAAQKKVERMQQVRDSAGALSSELIRALLGRFYETGDRWEVMAWRFDNSAHAMMRKTDAPKGHPRVVGKGSFHYEVTAVRPGAQPEVDVRITQNVDPKVESLNLTMSDSLAPTVRSYRMRGREALVATSPQGIRSAMTVLELFPLEVPDLVSAERREAAVVPDLPAEIRDEARSLGFAPDLSRSRWFEQDDFFGRPVQVLWEQGKPWPSYVRTPNGIAILVRKESQ